jgi:hypothetical protein
MLPDIGKIFLLIPNKLYSIQSIIPILLYPPIKGFVN